MYPAWDGFWPDSAPADILNMTINTSQFDLVVNWGVANNLKMIHHCF